MPKSETRRHAERLGLPVAGKPDSQDLCFAPGGDASGFVPTLAPHLEREGEIVDADGRVLGHHRGAFAFTVGQRRGLGVALGLLAGVAGSAGTNGREQPWSFALYGRWRAH